MNKRFHRAAAALLLPLLLAAGCYEKPTLTTHAPGEYKGKADSDAIMHPSSEQQSALVQRFRQVQTDR